MGDAVSWNIYRYAADFLHLGGMLLGLFAIWSARSVEGFSRKTQVLYQIVYVTRYLDVFTSTQGMYLLFFKVFYNLITMLMIVAFGIFGETYNPGADSCNIMAILVPTAVIAYLTSAGAGLEQEMWTYSELLEPLALLPQYIICYRATRVRPAAVIYVLAVGGYRLLYICNWIYKRYKWHGMYHDYTSWFGGGLEAVLFIDFVIRICQRKEVIGAISTSPLGGLLLHMDSGAGRLAEIIELSTIGTRLPFGLSGAGDEESAAMKKQWDVSDKLSDEESCQLLTLSGDAEQ